MKKVMGKKAQLNINMLVLLFLGIIIAAIVVFGVFGGFDAIFGKVDVLPGELEAAAQSCGISASQGLKTSYCDEFKNVKISGKDQYANCKYLESYSEFEKLGEECDTEKVELLAMELCETLNNNKLVNGKICYVDGEGDDEWGVSREHLSE
jgi:hypothetical protein